MSWQLTPHPCDATTVAPTYLAVAALEDVLPRVFEAAMANARKEKRDNITVKDIQAVQKSIKAGN